jgi:hypothetical protein
VDGAPTDLTYVSVWACRYITIVFPIIGKADVFIGDVNLDKSLWMNCTIESFTERPIFIKVAITPWVRTIGHSGPFGQPSPMTTSALHIIGKRIVMYLHAHTQIYTVIPFIEGKPYK